MRVFISHLSSTLGRELATLFQNEQHQVVGSVPQKSHVALLKRRLQEHPASDQPNALHEPVVFAGDPLAVENVMAKCDAVIHNICDDSKVVLEALRWLQTRQNNANNGASEAQREDKDTGEAEDPAPTTVRFVAVSNLLTWGRSPPLAKDSPGYQEEEFKQRKPARRFVDFKSCETQVLSANCDTLQTVVVASGLLYGGAQSDFRYLLREAWMNPSLDLIVPSMNDKKGDHVLPMMSVYDLAQVVFKVTLSDRDTLKRNYLIATDDAKHTLRHVCQAVSVHLGNGRLRDLTAAQVDELLLDDEAQSLTNLQMNAWFDKENRVMDSLGIEAFQYREGFVKHAAKIVADYIKCMDLRPLYMVVAGPPQVGKTHLAKQLAKTYCLPLVSMETTMKELFDHHLVAEQPPSDAGSSSTPQPPMAAAIAALQEKLTEVRETPYWEWSSEQVAELLKWKLTSAACRNQGYVLDGVPFTLNQAELLLAKAPPKEGDDAENGGGEAPDDLSREAGGGADNGAGASPTDGAGGDNGGIREGGVASDSASGVPIELKIPAPTAFVPQPNRVVMLTAPLELLQKRAVAMSQQEAEQTGNTQESFGQRMKIFTDNEDPLSTFFEKTHELEVLELSLEREEDFLSHDRFLLPVQQYIEQGHKPFNFHPTKQEIAAAQAEIAAKKRAQERLEKELADQQEAKDAADFQEKLLAQKNRLEIIQREEKELLEARAKPLRAYLMDTVLPALTEGMLEVVKVQPDDPIDYLAEFLFKKGQQLE